MRVDIFYVMFLIVAVVVIVIVGFELIASAVAFFRERLFRGQSEETSVANAGFLIRHPASGVRRHFHRPIELYRLTGFGGQTRDPLGPPNAATSRLRDED